MYNSDSDYSSRVELIKSILNELDITIVCEAPIDVSDYKSSIDVAFGSIRKATGSSGNIITLLQNQYSEYLFESFHNKICVIRGLDIETCNNQYKIYLYDDTHIRYDTVYAVNQNVYTPFVDDGSEITKKFLDECKETGGSDFRPNFYDALISITTSFLLQSFIDAPTFEMVDIRNQIYSTSINTALGIFRVDSSNHVVDTISKCIIKNDGTIEFDVAITNTWPTDTYRTSFNIEEYKYCDWRSDVTGSSLTKNTINIGVILQTENYNIVSSMAFFAALFASCNSINEENILTEYINLVAFSDGDSAEVTKNNMNKYSKNYNITVFIGGWTNEIRTAMHEVAENKSFIVIFPTDHEGQECLFNAVFFGVPALSYV